MLNGFCMEKYLIKMDDFSIKSENSLCFIDLHAPSSKNAISLLLASNLQNIFSPNKKQGKSIFENFLKEEKIVLIILRSLVKNIFCSGGHLRDLLSSTTPAHQTYGDSLRQFCQFFSSSSIPSITILAGNAYGGGVELALATDFRWTIGKNVEFHFAQTKLGVPGGWGGMTRLSNLCPMLSAKKVSSLFLAQAVLKFEDLSQMCLLDKSFANEDLCLLEIYKWRDNILSCDKNLREDFVMRQHILQTKLEEYDVNFFKKYFLSENHKQNIQNFLNLKEKGRMSDVDKL